MTTTRHTVTQPRLGPMGWSRWAWRNLTSMRTALFLLLLLSIAAVPGSIFPQRAIDAGRVAAELNRALDRLRTGNARAPSLSPDIVTWLPQKMAN